MAEIEQINKTLSTSSSLNACGCAVTAKRLVMKAAVFGLSRFVDKPSRKQLNGE